MGIYFESLTKDLIFSVVLICLSIFVYVKFVVFAYWERRGIKYFPPTFPFGNVGPVVRQKLHFGILAAELYRKTSEPFIGLFGTIRPTLMVRDPELLRNILIKDFNHFVDRGVHNDERYDPLSGHLFAMKGDRWKNLRVKMSPLFTSGKLKAMMSTLLKCGYILQNYIEEAGKNNAIVEVRDLTLRYTLDIIGSVAFGLDVNGIENPDNEFCVIGKKAIHMGFLNGIRTFCTQVYPKIQQTFRLKTTSPDVERYIMEIVKQTIQYREKNNVIRKDLMQLLIQMRNNGATEQDGNWETNVIKDESAMTLTYEEMAAQVWVFLLAGLETSSTTISFCLYELSINQNIQRKVHEEIDQISKKFNNQITYDSLQELKFLECCIDETLRKHPIVPVLNRECTKDYKIPGTNKIIEKGTALIIPVLGIQNDPKYYADPEQFRPERFFKENTVGKNFVEMPYMPFGEGPRVCIGTRLAKMKTKIGLFMMLQKNQFHWTNEKLSKLNISPKGFILTPKYGIDLKVTPRNPNV